MLDGTAWYEVAETRSVRSSRIYDRAPAVIFALNLVVLEMALKVVNGSSQRCIVLQADCAGAHRPGPQWKNTHPHAWGHGTPAVAIGLALVFVL